jgi:hypothetical protein
LVEDKRKSSGEGLFPKTSGIYHYRKWLKQVWIEDLDDG